MLPRPTSPWGSALRAQAVPASSTVRPIQRRLAWVLALLLPAPLFADDAAAQLDAVEVTSKRQAYRGDFAELEVPQSEQVIDAELLRDAGALDLDQALDLSASVARQNNFGGLWHSFALRGFVGDENLPSNFLVNGFNAGRGFGGPRDISSVERIEVLKGPRAALFGRGEPGGAVNLVSKRPDFRQAGSARLALGRFDLLRGEIDWQTALSSQAAVRLVGHHERADSFRDTVETRKTGFNPSLAWRLGEATQLAYELEYSDQEIPFDRGVVAVDGRLGQIPRSRFLGEPGDGPMQAEVRGHQVELQHEFSADWSALFGFTHRDTSLRGFSTEAELARNRQQLFVDGRTLSRQRRYRDYDANYQVLRGELSGRWRIGSVEHRVLIGVDGDRFENDQVFLRARPPTLGSSPSLAQLQAIDIFAPRYGQFPLPTPAPLTDRVEVQRSNGVFVQDQISLGDRVDIRIGLRHDDYRQQLRNRQANRQTREKASQTSPQFGAVYRVSDQLSLYSAYGENFRPLSGADFNGNAFEPNRSRSREVGLKLEALDGALSATAALFRVDQDNILVADPVNAGFSIAGGRARSEGFEFDLQGRLGESNSVWLSYAYTDAKMRNAVLDPNFALPVASGSRLLNIPEHSLSLLLVRDLQWAGRPLRIGGGLLHVGERLGEVGSDFELPDYTVVRAFASLALRPDIDLGAEIHNLFDQTYYSNSFSQLWVQPGAERSARLTLSYRF